MLYNTYAWMGAERLSCSLDSWLTSARQKHPSNLHPQRPCELEARGVPPVTVAYWSRARRFCEVISPPMRLCSPGYCERMINSQWNSLITVLVPSPEAGHSYLNRSAHNYCSGNRLVVNAASRQLIRPSIMGGPTNVPLCVVGQIYSLESNPPLGIGSISYSERALRKPLSRCI